ncbi:hypothetical protein I35_4092 [Burkholderia cenocepacia H111]|nr:hypothetical protein I35_4092 [Burkholderia cenocepacia H111]
MKCRTRPDGSHARTRCRVSGPGLRIDVGARRQCESFPNITDRLRAVVSRSAHLCENLS